jgi:hypothetical protein
MLVACADEAAAPPASTAPLTANTSPTATASTPATTSTTTSTSTTLPPTSTIPLEEQVKAQIAADYERAYLRELELLAAPSPENLDANAAQVAVPDSEAFTGFKNYILDLVRLGDRVVPYPTNLSGVTIEKVTLTGEPPYTEAIVTACEVSNDKQITPPENSPTGSEAITPGPYGELWAYRVDEPVRLTANGWLPFRGRREGQVFEGTSTCPAA